MIFMATIIEKKNKAGALVFEFRVSRGRNKSRLTRNWTAPDGWSHKAARREAEKQAHQFEQDVAAGLVLDKKEKAALAAAEAAERERILTFKDFSEQIFMPTKMITMAETSRSNYQGYLNNWIYPAIGKYKLPDITPTQIQKFLLSMQRESLSHSTLLKVYTILQGVFKMAFLQDAIPINPMEKVPRPKKGKAAESQSAETPSLTVAQLKQVYQALEQEPLRQQVLIHVLADTGIRRGEACGLQWTDIDFTEGVIKIERALQYTPHKGVYLDSTKSGKKRVVFVGPRTLALLKKLRIQQSQDCVSQWVFSQQGLPDPMHPQFPTAWIRKFGNKIGIDLHTHLLRHTFASLAITAGADIVSVSQVLGHADVSTTLRVYSHASPESAKAAAATFRAAIGEL